MSEAPRTAQSATTSLDRDHADEQSPQAQRLPRGRREGGPGARRARCISEYCSMKERARGEMQRQPLSNGCTMDFGRRHHAARICTFVAFTYWEYWTTDSCG